MAEFNDIEYVGIGGAREITRSTSHPGREVSPTESIITLCAGNSVMNQTDSSSIDANPPSSAALTPSPHVNFADLEPEELYKLLERDARRSPSVDGPNVSSNSSWTSTPSAIAPLERFCKEEQRHERIAVGVEDNSHLPAPGSSRRKIIAATTNQVVDPALPMGRYLAKRESHELLAVSMSDPTEQFRAKLPQVTPLLGSQRAATSPPGLSPRSIALTPPHLRPGLSLKKRYLEDIDGEQYKEQSRVATETLSLVTFSKEISVMIYGLGYPALDSSLRASRNSVHSGDKSHLTIKKPRMRSRPRMANKDNDKNIDSSKGG